MTVFIFYYEKNDNTFKSEVVASFIIISKFLAHEDHNESMYKYLLHK